MIAMRHDPRQSPCSTCRCHAKEIALARGCPKRTQDFVNTQPAVAMDTPAANAPRMPRQRASVVPARTRITMDFLFGFALAWPW
jgi:hypothetical protein